ncbi:transposase, partial [Cupriavidus gilardii]|nr:transposase [Cupriavidus gilardii]MDF9432849.1 transposase [Cupriavidus gilardii]
SAHSSSSMIGALIPSVPVVQMAKVNSLPKRLTAPRGSF